MRRKYFLFICIVLAGLALTACQGDDEPQTVKVVVSLPIGIEVGQDMLNGAQLALDQVDGQAGDVSVELLVFDSSDPQGSPVSPELEREAATQAVADEAVVAYLGAATSDQAKASMPLLNQASIVQISPTATWPGLTKPGYGPGEPGSYYPTGVRHFFRVAPSDEMQGAAGARWASQLGVQTVYIVHEDSAYGNGVAGIFELTAQDVGIEIIASESFDTDAASTEELASLAASAVQAQPDMLYYGGGMAPRGSEFVSAARGLDPHLQMMGPDGLVQDQLIDDVGADLVEGIYATNITVPADQLASAAAFRVDYKAAFGKEPPPFAAGTYEAMQALLHAIEHAKKPTREGVLAAMVDLGEFSGILGDWHFDERGDISITVISGMQIQDGDWTFVQVVE